MISTGKGLGELFWHGMGPYPTLRADTRWTPSSHHFPRIFHVPKSGKSHKQVPQIQECVISEEKGPCQATAGCRPNGFSAKLIEIGCF